MFSWFFCCLVASREANDSRPPPDLAVAEAHSISVIELASVVQSFSRSVVQWFSRS